MAKYKKYDYNQMMMVPVALKDQLMEGTMEYAINEVVDNRLNLGLFAQKYCNDDTGRPAYDPRILLKVVLLAYSRGIIGSRRIEKLCQENITFMALTCGQAPDHSTIAHFISSMKKEVIHLFRDILLFCDGMDLLGGTHFSLDGLKLPSNASKEWSGTFKDLKKKQGKLEEKLKQVIHEHEQEDKKNNSAESKREKRIGRIERKIERIERFLQEEEPKVGKTRAELQSNVTDNESAKMPTSHGVIQGYNSQALVDSKHQIIVHAEVFGNGQDHDNLAPMLCGARQNMETIGRGSDYFRKRVLSCDANYHNKENLKRCAEEAIDAYIPDMKFRKRDERYENQGRFRNGINPRKRMKPDRNVEAERFVLTDFVYNERDKSYHCPNGRVLKRNAHRFPIRHVLYDIYRSRASDCIGCPFRSKCLSKEDGKQKYILIPLARVSGIPPDSVLIEAMKQKIDTPQGRKVYSQRLAIVEPVFANIRSQKGLDRFTLRSKVKVNVQWLLYAMVHNIEKTLHYGLAY
jgi:transposase